MRQELPGGAMLFAGATVKLLRAGATQHSGVVSFGCFSFDCMDAGGVYPLGHKEQRMEQLPRTSKEK
jgi:hypothetical protein